ncbi:glutaminyl-peptide cyclotransferase, partial [Acrasis kona]
MSSALNMNQTMRLFKQISKQLFSFGTRTLESNGHMLTQKYIRKFFQKSRNWSVYNDVSYQQTPHGMKKFTNIVATYKPDYTIPSNNIKKQKIIFGAHYDSKLVDGKGIIGATDALVPVVMIMVLAKVFEKFASDYFGNLNLQCVFFDGEESLEEWTETDSLYGSRHLCELWDKRNKLKDINLLINLDLIGASGAEFYNYQVHYDSQTDGTFNKLSLSEKRLRLNRRLKTHENRVFFVNAIPNVDSGADDCTPFFKKGVPILHLIPLHFPEVWHTHEDNEDILDHDEIYDILYILKYFMVHHIFNFPSNPLIKPPTES